MLVLFDRFGNLRGWTLPEVTGLRKLLGPDWYRLLRGVVTNPLSVAGLIIVTVFILVAIFAPVLAPPQGTVRDPYLIPRDGFGPEPKPPGTVWEKQPPPLPFWYEPLTGNDQWVHIMGTASGQFDIWYGVIWGTRTALKAGLVVSAATLLIGVTTGTVAAYYGGIVDEILMRIVEIFQAFPFLLGRRKLSSTMVKAF